MSETLKNHPVLLCPDAPHYWKVNVSDPDAVSELLHELEKWFEGFETKMLSFKNSNVRCVEWLQKYTMIDPLDTMKLMQVQAALRTFIEKEILGK